MVAFRVYGGGLPLYNCYWEAMGGGEEAGMSTAWQVVRQWQGLVSSATQIVQSLNTAHCPPRKSAGGA